MDHRIKARPAELHLPKLLACALLILWSVAAAADDSITIGVIGDQTFALDLQAAYAIMEDGVGELSRQNLHVVLHTGDLLESSRPPAEVQAQFNEATAILDSLPVDWFLTAGDHDVNPPGFQEDSSDRSREQLFQQLYGARVPAVLQKPWYSFDVGSYHFIALYSHQALHSDPRFGNIFLAQIYNDQFEFLKDDLEDHKNAKGIIVFVHQALWYHASGWQRVHEPLARYPVAAVISGHHHYDQDSGTTDGIRYLTVGATGGFTKNGSRDAGDVHHVTVLKVLSDKVTSVKLISLSDNRPLELTPRVDMDRVQALDVQLGNFFDFAQRNPVFVKNGQMVGNCTINTPATVHIEQIGNPIDLPLTVKIAFSSSPSGVTLSGAAFGVGQCQTSSSTECRLARTARTFFSNYSSVLINEFTPLWTSGLAGTAQAGTVLRFNIRTTFAGSSGTLFLETDTSTAVQACP
ncbi:MAG: metallophosphoesterase [Acidobacteriota bacterium]